MRLNVFPPDIGYCNCPALTDQAKEIGVVVLEIDQLLYFGKSKLLIYYILEFLRYYELNSHRKVIYL